MLARIADEDLLKVRTAYGQHDFVRLQQLAIARQRHVHQIAAIVQILEAGRDVVLEIIPAQRKLVVHRCAAPREGCWFLCCLCVKLYIMLCRVSSRYVRYR